MLKAKGQKAKGNQPDKAQMVAWIYTRQEIDAWQAAQNLITLPAIMANGREPGQTSTRDYFQG